MVFVAVGEDWRSIGSSRSFQFISCFEDDLCGSCEISVMDEQIEIAGGTGRKVMVDERPEHHSLKWHGRNRLVIEGFEDADQFRCVCEIVEDIAVVLGSQAFLHG